MSGYLRFKLTGNELIDNILRAIECAGDAYHGTHMWNEGGENGESYSDLIQEAANKAAERYKHVGKEYPKFQDTGVYEVDYILWALNNARNASHGTGRWEEKDLDCKSCKSAYDLIQEKAYEVAKKCNGKNSI